VHKRKASDSGTTGKEERLPKKSFRSNVTSRSQNIHWITDKEFYISGCTKQLRKQCKKEYDNSENLN
jgi:hypothetical protein